MYSGNKISLSRPPSTEMKIGRDGKNWLSGGCGCLGLQFPNQHLILLAVIPMPERDRTFMMHVLHALCMKTLETPVVMRSHGKPYANKHARLYIASTETEHRCPYCGILCADAWSLDDHKFFCAKRVVYHEHGKGRFAKLTQM